MSMTIEIIEGGAYAVVDGKCEDCVFAPKEDVVCGCGLPLHKCYRRLTAEERTGIIKAMERGI